MIESIMSTKEDDEREDQAYHRAATNMRRARYLNWSLDESIIPKDNASPLFKFITLNEAGFLVAKEFFYCKISDIYEYYQRDGDSLGVYVNYIAAQMKTKEELEELQSFITKSSRYFKEPDLVINQITETITKNIEWTAKFYNKIVGTKLMML
ncbi:uncharacterized protein LOC100575943 [Acyrthosiphon pisum]|uniref:ERAP1-like C-terminal domain-containing protein n=1 Tax=Acyrthosiphon pisum TaxID=7029 RepID=A0A8R2A8G8_ACYPI|nr:uncharacterized protein LOC100575943 [Acyrthosiphon pisum]|eukprot:XP_003246242.2 PREDICTED: uncharacterized protein LOC100575943 [Acyrthosiphon pisum]